MRSAIKVEPATAVVDVVPNEPQTSRDVWGPAALEQRRERTRDHLAKIAGRRETWIKRSRHHYGLLNRLLRFLMEPQKKFSQSAAYVRQSGRSYWIPVHGRTILRQTG